MMTKSQSAGLLSTEGAMETVTLPMWQMQCVCVCGGVKSWPQDNNDNERHKQTKNVHVKRRHGCVIREDC